MLYVIEKDGLFLASGGQYVSQSGMIGDGTKPPVWVRGKLSGIGTSNREHAQLIADLYGGKVVVGVE